MNDMLQIPQNHSQPAEMRSSTRLQMLLHRTNDNLLTNCGENTCDGSVLLRLS